ncbi:TAXI family TRAP transporter solute-binding subunit [Cohaesibacter celericrescens]|uniref:C4-dicarboxylate ABC transporter substrate-binding protein n=1 Tax=Cohaesibacter celericrescens TaxID=2067669 RepID=A0A2N5XXQ8_9HYPH|nr:TAXI family TRAP transporter solute-binding subunit [Cohaesibacter celericrescens]PLW79225.1 C4-dicarboxylate ABC transporter substrate-binding protein [Cohaesibacter celericrescens]
MKKLVSLLAGTCVSVAMLAASAASAETIKIAAEEPGGGWYSYGATFTKLIEDKTDLDVEIIPRGGGVNNPPVVDRNIGQFGFTTGNAAAWSQQGLEAVYKGKKSENIRSVTGGMQGAFTVVFARKAYIDKVGVNSFEELLKLDELPRVGMEPAGSQVPIIADLMLQMVGSGIEDLRSKGALTQVSSSKLAEYMRDGRIDLMFENVPLGHPAMTENSLTNELSYVAMGDKVIDGLGKFGMPRGIMPKGAFKGVLADYPTALSSTIFITNTQQSDETVYKVLKALDEGGDALREEHAALRGWTAEKGCQPEQAVLELHPGAMKYCKEKGYLK